MIKLAGSSEMLVPVYLTTRRQIPKVHNPKQTDVSRRIKISKAAYF
jgi:hypothetical protein